ncbi:hypothetical protein Hanom_Chr16g01475261 [Helianthus anomalus]
MKASVRSQYRRPPLTYCASLHFNNIIVWKYSRNQTVFVSNFNLFPFYYITKNKVESYN